MYLTTKDIRSKIHNEEYATALKMLLERFELLEAFMNNYVNPSYQILLSELLEKQEKE